MPRPPATSQATLSGLLNIAGSSVVKMVDDLEKMELVKRMPSTDRRVYALHLTERGSADMKRYQASNRTFEKSITAELTAKKRELFLLLLSKVAPGEV